MGFKIPICKAFEFHLDGFMQRINYKEKSIETYLEEIKQLKIFAKKLRQSILAMAYHAGGAHIAPAFSMVDILTVLYWKYLNIKPKNSTDPNRDRFILSKGHGCAALYAVLAEKGFFDKGVLKTFCNTGSILGGHPDKHLIPGVEASTGSLGHGMSIALGMAYAGKLGGKGYKVMVLLGDGECQEGSIWEAAMAASQLKLDNFNAIIDYNKLQGMGPISEINELEPLADKWKSFGWSVREIDGHDHKQIMNALSDLPYKTCVPSLIIAHTIKGKGVSFMENKALWHYRLPTGHEMEIACKELGIENIEGVLL